jgi:hypothetical protein
MATERGAPAVPDALAIAANAPAERIARRLASALRIRALHGTVLRRTTTLASRGELPGELPSSDPLDDATVLVAGRGRSYPALSVAVGERVGLVGALSVESAAHALNARDIDGMVVGDGFGPRIVEALLTAIAEDVRFRDLPVAVLGGHLLGPGDVPGGRVAEEAAVFPAELRSALITHLPARSTRVHHRGQHETSCLLKTHHLLVLQGAH